MNILNSWVTAGKAVVLGGIGGVIVIGEIIKGIRKTEETLEQKVYQGEEAKKQLKMYGLYKEDPEAIKAEEMLHHVKSFRDNIVSHLFCDDSGNFIINVYDLKFVEETANHFGYKITKLYEDEILPEGKNCFLIQKFNRKREIEYQRYLLFNVKKVEEKYIPILAIKNPSK